MGAIILRSITATLLAVWVGACSRTPGAQGPAAIPAVSGAYPDEPRLPGGAPARPVSAGEGWMRAETFTARLSAAAAPLAFYRALPVPGERVPVRSTSWPGAVRFGGLGDDGVLLQGDSVDAHRLSGDLRCGDRDDAGRSVRLVARVSEDGHGLAIEAGFAGPDPAECFVSAAGRRRLTAIALDLYLWARATSRAGAELPMGGG